MSYLDVVGTIAAICTTGAYLPQAIKVITTKDTKALSLITYLVLTFGVALWLIYAILKKDLPLAGANAITFLLSGIILVIKIRNKD